MTDILLTLLFSATLLNSLFGVFKLFSMLLSIFTGRAINLPYFEEPLFIYPPMLYQVYFWTSYYLRGDLLL